MIRTTVIPNKQIISFEIPKDYVGWQIEVIAFARDEGIVKEEVIKKQVTFNALLIDTKGYKFNREEANER
ncbi:hypothetical protein [Dyadobacter frigoris]|uniref:Uncharacterized protein n=1 Tax=Dyadobacter frigoris TaxID=2576211 RepID=A0A4U6D2L6_9BACT|nr:hypothetical protein [Dyadobacter frigoris]TKT90886.1 hypothetical protein FDK13_18140 [Dyadobacter frigoris]GLU56750.1 hypothetical protein Dfri01_62110 [Dyadobacter frigoris]